MELMLRPWHVSERSMRPDHRMVAHTGFLTTARKCTPRPGVVWDRNITDDGKESRKASWQTGRGKDKRRVKRQLLYSFVYLAWTAILLFGVIWFAALHLCTSAVF